MRRRTLLIIALSLLLVIPAVMAVASSGFETDVAPAVTADKVQEQSRDCGECLYESTIAERDQVRDRDQDRTNAPSDADQKQIQEQKQLRIQEPATGDGGEETRTREREQVRDEADCVGDGLQLREQVRAEAQIEHRLAEPQGEGAGYVVAHGQHAARL